MLLFDEAGRGQTEVEKREVLVEQAMNESKLFRRWEHNSSEYQLVKTSFLNLYPVIRAVIIINKKSGGEMTRNRLYSLPAMIEMREALHESFKQLRGGVDEKHWWRGLAKAWKGTLWSLYEIMQ
jgi:hypothetical protein